ncbi:uncharacterized protein LOC121700578 isoform X2 [Alosa sapidissima]|uniref:uncharacterized protein LOC121700578 isoform X2 n=1 Tax=Alosa sapidissima TaxID=34773 RepID=UPI001C08DE54|nr:uncharacterized protein LOC121700578 isoform X2 [Alosa sapidissima]
MRTLIFLTAVTVCWFMVKAKPTIKMIPKYGRVYWGDTVKLKCSVKPTGEWLYNDKPHTSSSQILILNAVSSKDSGNYQCKATEKSDIFRIDVLDYLPPAFLTVVSGHAVVNKNESSLLQLFSDEGLTNWICRILRNDQEYNLMIPEDIMAGKTMQFYATVEGETPEIVWCKKKGTENLNTIRSNSISLRSSDMEVLLEIPTEPAVLGEPLTLRCEVRGGAKIEAAKFFKDDVMLGPATDGSYEISVTDGSDGSYRCTASYRYIFIKPHGALKKNVPSDPQTLIIRARPRTAVITKDASALLCTCSDCPTNSSFYWYHREPNAMDLTWRDEKTSRLIYDQPGKYACRAVWGDGASRPSKFQNIEVLPGGSPVIYLVVVLIIAGLLLVAIALVCRIKRRGQSALQGDVPMRSVRRKKGAEDDDDTKDDAYQPLKGSDKDEYHTVQARPDDGADGGYEAVGGARTGDGGDVGYEALKGKAQAEVYHTLQATGSQGADGGYEALKGKAQAEVYHTLQATGSQGADGGYEALKGTKQNDTYETLKPTAGDGGDGGEPEEKGLYQKLGSDGGDGGYEELKKEADSKNDGGGGKRKTIKDKKEEERD